MATSAARNKVDFCVTLYLDMIGSYMLQARYDARERQDSHERRNDQNARKNTASININT
jgi:hypothetical protein